MFVCVVHPSSCLNKCKQFIFIMRVLIERGVHLCYTLSGHHFKAVVPTVLRLCIDEAQAATNNQRCRAVVDCVGGEQKKNSPSSRKEPVFEERYGGTTLREQEPCFSADALKESHRQ